jgi:C-terminal processing protease CtpA/Prc
MFKTIVRNCLILLVFVSMPVFASMDGGTFDSDHEFDSGSRIRLERLNAVQLENLAVLGKVWGFLKYHHPLITTGQRQWDFELLRVVPKILAAPDRPARDDILHEWILGLGPFSDCVTCARLGGDNLQLRPDLAWLSDPALLSAELRNDLDRIYRHRRANVEQFYVSLAPYVGNPNFLHEPEYKTLTFPDAGFQLLSLFRLWNIVEYWAPYRDQIGEDWNSVLRESIPTVVLAKDRAAYELAMIAVIARIHDTHANLWSSLRVRAPLGKCQLPVTLRFLDGHAVVSGYTENVAAGKTSGLVPGDVIASIDGRKINELVEAWKPYYAASNEPTQLRDIARELNKGNCGPSHLVLKGDGGEKAIDVSRFPILTARPANTHDRPGDTFQLLDKDVAYMKLSSIKRADIPSYMQRAAATKGLVIDIRNYPSDFVPFALGQYFVDKPTRFVTFTVGDLNNPGAFRWGQEIWIQPQDGHYAGKVIILVDETSQSQAEYTAMALRIGPNTKVIGSTTAGADGNVSTIPLPGGLRSMISGIGVFYPDRRPTQRIGIVPDIEVRPTIEGIRAGRDELLETAIAEIRR